MRAGRVVTTAVVLAALAVAAFLPNHLNGNYVHILTLFFTMAILAQAWNFIGGFAGYVSFGNVTFFGTGAYACAYAMNEFHWPFFVALAFAILVGGALALVVGAPILRLRGHYFAIATLGLGIGTQALVAQVPAFGQGSGMTLPLNSDFHFFYWTMLAILAAGIIVTYLVANSRFGFALAAIRENEEAAAALGINTAVAKVAAWGVSGALTGAAGATFAYWTSFIDPSTVFDLNFNVQMIIMTIIGGAGTVAGPTIGAAILYTISEYLGSQSISPWHAVALGAIIVFVVIVLPRGIMPYLTGRRMWNARAIGDQLRASRI
ncbi:MAG TPA: branched-chain amino acid ABC transporter permease [Candidatus Tumulicola sp.]|nr:branched-chain amino acid ABC transporter permease [Candidatus Tumulicola sp.]